MQLYALEGSTPIAASHAEKEKNYHCPECGSIVRLRGGPSRQTHFYHLLLSKECKQHTKSLEHLQLQWRLLDLIGEEGQMECSFPSIRRIADVAWHAKKIVFEIQRSNLSMEEAQNRTSDYQKAGYTVIWILHDKQFNRSTLSAAENYLRQAPCYFTNIDPKGKGIVYDQFEVIEGHRRLFKGPQLPISPTAISSLPKVTYPNIRLPQLILQRLEKWGCYAAGDLLCRLLKEGNLSIATGQMITIESRFKRSENPTPRLPLRTLLAKSYLGALEWALKKIT